MDDSNDDSKDKNENADDEQHDELEKRRRKQSDGRIRPGSSPRRLSDPNRSGGQVPPRGRITRLGGVYDESYGMKPGQNVWCVVAAVEAGGYSVTVKHGERRLPGYLPTQQRLKHGDEILATYVCVHKRRVLLTARFGNSESLPAPSPVYEIGSRSTSSNEADTAKNQEQVSYTTSDSSDSKRTPHSRRSTDLMPVAIEPEKVNSFLMNAERFEEIVEGIAEKKFTGVLKVQSTLTKSRGAVLLYCGRVIGCIQTSLTEHNTQPTEPSIPHFLELLKAADAAVEQYSLPDRIACPMGALFIGYPVQRSDDYTASEYFNYIFSWLSAKKLTACISVCILPKTTILSFIYRGTLGESFFVDRQNYLKGEREVLQILHRR